MAQAIILRCGAGGVTSDDVTASKAQVLQGYKTITVDSDDEVVEGTIPNRGTWSIASEVVNATGEGTVHVRFEEGYYIRDGQYKPTAKIPYAVLSNVIGVDTTKMLQSLMLAGKQGQIKEIDTRANNSRVNKSTSYGIDSWSDASNPIFYIDLPHGNAYYRRDDGHPHVCIDADKLGNATADKVLAGSTFTSKNGLAVQGTMPNRGNGMKAVDFYNAHWESNFVARMEPGYYSMAGEWKPYVAIPYAVLANIAGVDQSKMLQTLTIAGKQGQIKTIKTSDDNYNINKSVNYGIDGFGRLYMDLPHGNAYYYRDDGHPHTCIDAVHLGDAGPEAVLQGVSASSAKGLKFSGGIPRWTSLSHVVSAVNNEGFVWDDNTGANRGRGIVSKIAKGRYIENADWVFLSSPNLYPQNVVKGININGVTGTRDFTDKVNDYTVAANLEISMSNREQVIQLGNAYSGSETVFFGIDLVGEDVYDGFVRRDKGNGHYLIGRIPVSKSDSNLIGTFIRNVPVQIEIIRDGAGNISLVHHGPNQVLGATKLNIYIYAHSSISFRL